MKTPTHLLRQTRGIPWRKRIRHHINLVRWTLDRCEHCGHRFAWKGDARHATGNRDGKVFHGSCLALRTWRTKAEERLWVLDRTLGCSGTSEADVKFFIDFGAETDDERIAASNRAFRVFYDLSKQDRPWTIATAEESR